MAAEFSSTSLEQFSAVTIDLLAALNVLEDSAALLQRPALAGREWYELLRQKLVPQFGSDAFLVAAVVGGTNIGKSVVFNHLAGCRASASSPMASGTKHPVCLVPRGFRERHSLEAVFPDFELCEWATDAAALQESEQHLLFWRSADELPPRLLVLDTPDIDSDARINWVRADAVRRCADVLIAVLTQQKYNDAAVKEFFRKAAAEDKAVIVVFNQCLIPDDEAYWPIWLKTFCRETGVRPEGVYVAPSDRRAAEDLRLPFVRRQWQETDNLPGPAVPTGQSNHPQGTANELARDLASLRFEEIRTRTLLGSVRELLHPQRGVPAYLSELRRASTDLSATAQRLTSDSIVTVRNWPSPGNPAVVAHVREWWKARQHGWARRINQVYSTVGTGVIWPFRAARNAIVGEPVPPMVEYREREWTAVMTAVEELYDRLEWMAQSGSHLIRPRIDQALSGNTRKALLDVLRQQHAAVDFDQELSEVVDEQLSRFRTDSPEMFRLYSQLNQVSAAVRPVTSVVLFSLGFGPAGEAVAPLLADAAAQAVIHVVADVAGGATVAVAGEAAVSGAAGTGAGLVQSWFHGLFGAFTAQRTNWLSQLIHRELLGSLPEDLVAAAAIPESREFGMVQAAVLRLEQLSLTQAAPTRAAGE